MVSSNQESKILQYRKKKYFNIGLVIFGIIFIYLVITVVMYLTAPHITPYEVREGSVLKDNAYTGLAIREETVVYSDASGYINYCAQNNGKVRAHTNIYALSAKKLELNSDTSVEDIVLTEEEQHTLLMKIQNFNENYKDSTFSDTYLLKNEIENMLQNITSQSKLDQINTLLANGNPEAMTLYPTSDDGIVVQSVDGLEGLTKDTVTHKHLQKENYEKTEFQNNSKINAGDPVYKLITDEEWTLAVRLSQKSIESLAGKNFVKVRFVKDNQTLWAELDIKAVDDKFIAFLSFSDSMIRYANERYLDIELIFEDQSGLKIPKTAITTKDFYVVPKSYLTSGGNTKEDGVLKQTVDKNGKKITEFLTANVYYEDNETVYLNPDLFETGDVLLKPESTETFELKEKQSLKGVYNINKGYAVFKQVRILGESEEYYIIEEGNSYGLSNYDHIALDSKNIKENDVVF